MKASDCPTCPQCGHMLVAEPHYSHAQLALLFQRRESTVIAWLRAGKFGVHVLKVGRDFFVPLSGYQSFIARHGVFSQDNELKPVVARSDCELRRRIGLLHSDAEVAA